MEYRSLSLTFHNAEPQSDQKSWFSCPYLSRFCCCKKQGRKKTSKREKLDSECSFTVFSITGLLSHGNAFGRSLCLEGMGYSNWCIGTEIKLMFTQAAMKVPSRSCWVDHADTILVIYHLRVSKPFYQLQCGKWQRKLGRRGGERVEEGESFVPRFHCNRCRVTSSTILSGFTVSYSKVINGRRL